MLLGAALPAQQIILNNEYFPEAGDTLKYNVAADGFVIDLLGPGENVNWNFGELAVDREIDRPVISAVDDPVFTDADIFMDIDANTVGYYRVNATSVDLIGLRGKTPLLDQFMVEAPLNPSRPDRRAPLSYGDAFDITTSNRIVVSPDSLPQEALDELGSLITEVDSIRLTTTSVRQDIIDAAGTLTINNQTYDVIREKRTEILATTVEVKTGIFGYIDITSNLRSLFPEYQDFIGPQPLVTTFYFWSPGEKEAIATVTQDSDGTYSQLTYKRGDAINSTGGPYLRQADINVYPNPAHGQTFFEVNGLDAGDYTISVLNVLGRKVADTRFSPIAGEAKVPLDLGKLPRGTYLYSLTNERGRILTTRRLMVGG